MSDYESGAKWMQEQMYNDMQEYATFCVECDRKATYLVLVSDLYKKLKI